jgi:hypothetical protein
MNDRSASQTPRQKPLDVVTLDPPPPELRSTREARPVGDDEKKNRYHLPDKLESPSPVGFRERMSFDRREADQLLELLALERPSHFVDSPDAVTEQELFEETSLGILTARQSTNFRGHRETVLGPEDSERATQLLRELNGRKAPVLEHATHTHIVFSRPYRTLFTLLLTFVGHTPLLNLLTVPWRAIEKTVFHKPDIPTVDYLQQLHVGILADDMERAAVVASGGRRMAQIQMAPFAGEHAEVNSATIRDIEQLAGLTGAQRREGWELAMVAQVGEVPPEQRVDIEEPVLRKFGANKMAFRSERIQPGVNQDDDAPEEYQTDQEMEVPEEMTVQCGRAAYNAFCHWTGLDRDRAKRVMLLDRIDARSEHGRQRLRETEAMLDEVTDDLIDNLPTWADVLSGFALSRNAERGRKAFALSGQRIYIGGLDEERIHDSPIDWRHAVRASGAASARAALYAELMGATEVPDDCDLLAGICQMAGPVNQNDIGKQFYAHPDLLAGSYPDADPTSLLVWTLKAKTVADPIGNEEQVLSEEHKGALVDLRPGPHEVVDLCRDGECTPMRERAGQTNQERAFSDCGNFATSPTGDEIPGNRGEAWPDELRSSPIWDDE